jgi:hypothetical protein
VPGSPGGIIGGSATINISAANIGDPTNHGDEVFNISNTRGTIGNPATGLGDATISVTTGSITANSLLAEIDNSGGGLIAANANLTLNLSGGLTTQLDATFHILNENGGTIAGLATINVAANNITANSLDVGIDTTEGIVGYAEINMNVARTANVTNDATVAIYGSDGSVEGAAININGGSYDVGGTFLSFIDGNGTITFNNATAHADVLKAGVFGANGALNIGGGMLSADTRLELYAPGSNGQLNFFSNVTLGGTGAKILAANSVTIFNGVVVTIGGPVPADVFTNNANYTGFGGNGSTTGTFGGAGANDPQPLAIAPPFRPSSLPNVRAGGSISSRRTTVGTPIATAKPSTLSTTSRTTNGTTSTKTAGTTIDVRNTDQLLSLLDNAVPDPAGKITVPNSKRIGDLRNSSRLNADRALRANRGAMDSGHLRSHSANDSRVGVGKRIL